MSKAQWKISNQTNTERGGDPDLRARRGGGDRRRPAADSELPVMEDAEEEEVEPEREREREASFEKRGDRKSVV